jgi:hypothetical protein
MDNGQREGYFRKMSKTYALLCGGCATLMTQDPKNIPQDGIWAQTEQPTLQRTTNFDPPRQTCNVVSKTKVSRRALSIRNIGNIS